MTLSKSTAIVITCLLLGSTIATAADKRFTLLERELEYLVEIWPGDYDNREQLSLESDVGKKDIDSGGHLRVHSQVSRVDIPALGDYVLYVEEYKNGDPTSIFRQRLYVLSADEDKQAIRLKLMFFNDGKPFLGAHKNPALLDAFDNSSVMALEGCDVFIQRDGDWFAGTMETKTCVFGADDNRRYSDYQVRITDGQYWFRDRILNADTDEVMEQVANFGWHQLEQARWFSCMIDFPKEPGGRPTVTHHYIDIHDQGGKFEFADPDGRDIVLTMRNTWSYGMQRESFVIVVQENDESGPVLVYAWGKPGADRIGVNPGYLRVQCDLNTPRQVKLQRELRPDS